MSDIDAHDPSSIAHRIHTSLATDYPNVPIFVVDETGSTNADLLQQEYETRFPSCVLLALKQSHGRGRQGRTWLSDEGSLTFSIRWQFKRSPAALSGLPLAVAVATMIGLESIGETELCIKWPNDLMKGSAKLGGILLEIGKPLLDGMTSAVIGIGMNLVAPKQAHTLGHTAASILTEDRHEEISKKREETLISILKTLLPSLIQFDNEGFEPFRQEWMRHAAWLGQSVMLSNGSQGTLIGVDHDGALLLDTELCIERFLSGDLSLRTANASNQNQIG